MHLPPRQRYFNGRRSDAAAAGAAAATVAAGRGHAEGPVPAAATSAPRTTELDCPGITTSEGLRNIA